jgi:ketosteroid isomerase-like protein
MRTLSLTRTTLLATALTAALAAAAGHPTDSLIQAERDFSALSVEKGMRTAFLANLADDAILFRPGPINGMQSWQARSEVPGRLAWGPGYVEISGAEDFGFSFGPWEYRETADAKSGDFGDFLTVWRRDARGAWKVALDCGISHENPNHGVDLEPALGPMHAPPDTNAWRHGGLEAGGSVGHGGVGVAGGTGGFGISFGGGGFGLGVGGYTGYWRSPLDYEHDKTAHENNNLMTADRTLGFNVKKTGWAKAYAAVSAPDLRYYRSGAQPMLGIDDAAAANASRTRDVTWDYRGNGMSKSWDMGYVYGLAIARTKGQSKPDTSAFVHFYRVDEAGKWKLMADWEGAFPKRKP